MAYIAGDEMETLGTVTTVTVGDSPSDGLSFASTGFVIGDPMATQEVAGVTVTTSDPAAPSTVPTTGQLWPRGN